MINIISTAICYTQKLCMKVNPELSLKEKPFFHFLILYLYEIMNVL